MGVPRRRGAGRTLGAAAAMVALVSCGAASGCAGSGYPPVPFDVRYAGPQGLTPVYVLEDGYAYWWFENEPAGEVVFVNPASFEEFVIDPRTRARVFLALEGNRYSVEPGTGRRLPGGAVRGMTLAELGGTRYRPSAVEAPIGWRERVRETREKERQRQQQSNADRETNRVAESVRAAQEPDETGSPEEAPRKTSEEPADVVPPAPLPEPEAVRPMLPPASGLIFPAFPPSAGSSE